MQLMVYIFLFILVVLSGMGVFAVKHHSGKGIKLLLAFSGAYLFAISILHLIPEIYRGMSESIGIYILIGFFLQIVLEFFSRGIEHGHIHHHEHEPFPFAVLVSLCIHSFLEGMPFAKPENASFQSPLLIGVILHKIPVSFVLGTLLLKSGIGKFKMVGWLSLFGLMLPMGAVVGMIAGESLSVFTPHSEQIILAMVVGIFLHISTTILFESSENHKFNAYKLLTILLGVLLAMGSHHH